MRDDVAVHGGRFPGSRRAWVGYAKVEFRPGCDDLQIMGRQEWDQRPRDVSARVCEACEIMGGRLWYSICKIEEPGDACYGAWVAPEGETKINKDRPTV